MAARRRTSRRRVTKRKRATKKRRRVKTSKKSKKKRARKTSAKKNKKKSRRTRRRRKRTTSKKNKKQEEATTQQQEQQDTASQEQIADEAEGSLSAEILAAQSEELSEEVKPLDADLTSTETAEKNPESAETGSEEVVSLSVEMQDSTDAGLPAISEEAALQMSHSIMPPPTIPKKRKGGRPKGSKDKKKRKAGSGRPKGSKDGKKRKAQDPTVRKKRSKKQKTEDSYEGEECEGSYEQATYETSSMDQISINEEQKVESVSENHDTVEVLKQFVATSDAELLGGTLV